MVTSQILVTFVIATVSSVVLIAVAMPTYDVVGPDSVALVVGGFVLVGLLFASIGVLLGAVLPSSRAAQAVGVLFWFVLLIVGGAGPPPEVLTGAMGTVGDITPLRHGIRILQDGWLSLDPGISWPIVAIVAIVCGLLAMRFFRWE